MFNIALFMMGGGEGGSWTTIIFMGAIFAIFYWFIIRPQSQRQKEMKQKREGVKKGDKIYTSGGMIANVTSVDDDTVLAEIDKGVKVRFRKGAITDVNPNKNDN